MSRVAWVIFILKKKKKNPQCFNICDHITKYFLVRFKSYLSLVYKECGQRLKFRRRMFKIVYLD